VTPVVAPPLPISEPDANSALERRGRGPDLDRLHRLAAYLIRESDLVLWCIRMTMADPKQMAEVAERSYRHVNGFAKIRILQNERYSARLHVWPEGKARLGDVDPHGHRWEFASWVVAGKGVAERIYVETPGDNADARPYLRFEYQRPLARSGRLVPTGRHTWLKQERDRVHGPGEINACDLERVHTVAPAGAGLVATVLLQGRDQLGATKVFRPDETERDITERPLEVDEQEQLFDDVLRAMGEVI
jgi:hypothetical protein